MSAQVSVTEVRNALRCARLFALGREGERVRFPVGPSSLGAVFHRLAERLAGAAGSPPAALTALGAGASPAAVAEILNRWLLDFLIDELEGSAVYSTMPAEVDDLAEALRQLGVHLASRLVRFTEPPAVALGRLLHAAEQPVEAQLGPSGVRVTGRMDAVYMDERGHLDLIEYKLSDERDSDLDQAQVALYRTLLKRDRGVDASPVILRFGPALSAVTLDAAQADTRVERQLVPLLESMASWARDPSTAPATERRDLCGNCPLGRACAERYADVLPRRDAPPASALRPRPGPGGVLSTAPVSLGPMPEGTRDETGQQEMATLAERIVKEMRRQGLTIEVTSRQIGPTLLRLGVRGARNSLSRLDKAAREVLVVLERPGARYEKPTHGRAFVVPRVTARPVDLGPLLASGREWLAASPGRFVLGEQPDGEVLRVDLADPATPHLLIGGQAGSGKSSLLLIIASGLVQFHGPEVLRLSLVDPKRVTFGPTFRTAIGAHLDGPILYSAEATMPLLDHLVDDMEQRYASFESAGVSDLTEYNEQAAKLDRLPRRVVLVDEFADLAAGGASKEFFSLVDRLGAKARAAGIHLVLATQRPDRETVPSRLKANLGGKIALRVASKINSQIILGQNGAEELLGKGDLLAELGRGVVRAQAARPG